MISVVLVNWNGWADTIACVQSLLNAEQTAFRIVIVDNASTNESVEMFPSDAIFTVDHVLDVQQLQSQFMLEYQRKQDLIESLTSIPAPVDNMQGPMILLNSDIDSCMTNWDDGCEQSFIDSSLVEQFLRQNLSQAST